MPFIHFWLNQIIRKKSFFFHFLGLFINKVGKNVVKWLKVDYFSLILHLIE